jgi:hypothetical protein
MERSYIVQDEDNNSQELVSKDEESLCCGEKYEGIGVFSTLKVICVLFEI